jgi:TPR repeat protein
MSKLVNHYEKLQIDLSASDIVIRAAYKSLAQKYHPDKFEGDKKEADRYMQEINEAYRILSNPELKNKYDEQVRQINQRAHQSEIYNQAVEVVKRNYSEYQKKYEKKQYRRWVYKQIFKSSGIIALAGALGLVFFMSTHAQGTINLYKIMNIRDNAKLGDAQSQVELGYLYQDKNSFLHSDTRAFEWYEKAANQGNAQAQYNVGSLYYSGFGVDKNYGKAFDYFAKSAQQGNYYAQINLSYLYDNGIGVNQNHNLAKLWYKAAQKNNPQDNGY